MKIAAFSATNVHGYLPINVTFNDDLTFITGLNGTGKTTGLRLMLALLGPNIEELGAITFDRAEVHIVEHGRFITISAMKASGGVSIQISTDPNQLYISGSDLQLLIDLKRREESRSPIHDRYQGNEIYKRIRSIATPMFLGIDRRFYAPFGTQSDDFNELRKHDYMARRYWQESAGPKSTAIGALVEVNFLVVNKLQEIRARQEKLDETLRTQFFTKAFEYKPSDFGAGKPMEFPSRDEVTRYRQQLSKIEQAADAVKIPVPAIQAALSQFLERMIKVVDSLERSQAHNQRRSHSRRTEKNDLVIDSIHVEWIVNKPQADRIVEHLSMLEAYIEQRNSLRASIDRFLLLVNSFFEQTKKQVVVAQNGQLGVTLAGNPDVRSVDALSSGERQLLVMLAHLSLNEMLVDSGVFIVDEPELSLHIDWQEKFVDAIRAANPKVQLILATHSPAIILDRDDACRVLRGVANA